MSKEIEHFCRRRAEKVAKSVQCGEPNLVRSLGRMLGGLFLFASSVGSHKQIKRLASVAVRPQPYLTQPLGFIKAWFTED